MVKRALLLLTFSMSLFMGIAEAQTTFQSKYTLETLAKAPVKLIPFPQEVVWGRGAIPFTKLRLDGNALLPKTIQNEVRSIFGEAGIQLKEKAKQQLHFIGNKDLSKEEYRLSVSKKGITITAATEAGQFYALQTLRQLISIKGGHTRIQLCKIKDFPAFPIRGYMVDVGRNFQSITSLKGQLDVMALYKLNTFQWHLTDRPAWRVESKRYPELTDAKNHRSTRDPGKFYTYDEIRELIHYANSKQIQVIPEIDMPGHSDSFVKATGHKMESPEGMVILENVLEEFFKEIPRELCPTIHIGSDEVHIANPKAFMDKMVQVCRTNGREVMIWNPGLPADNRVIRQTWKPDNVDNGGYREIDSWNNYVNNGDPFIHIPKLFFKPIGNGSKNEILGGILCLWHDVNVDNEEDVFLNNPTYPSLLTYAWTTWTADVQYASKDYLTMVPPKGSPENAYFAAFEGFLIHHKKTYFKEMPFPYVAQANIQWKLYGPFKGGVPDLESEEFKLATGNTVYIRDRFKQGGQFPKAKPGETYYAETYIFSERNKKVDAWIGFESPYRANRIYSGIPNKGLWDNNGGTIRINGEPQPAPEWKHPGWKPSKTSGWGAPEDQEIPWKKEELYWTRPPTKILLKKGWNKVRIKVPGTNAYQNWMFTFAILDQNGLKISTKPDKG